MIEVKRKKKPTIGKSELFVPVTGRCRRNMMRIDVAQFKAERFIRNAAKRARLKKITNVAERGTQSKTVVDKIKGLLSPRFTFS